MPVKLPHEPEVLLPAAESHLFSCILREVLPLDLLQKPFKKLRQELPVSENAIENTLALALQYGFLRQDSSGYYHYPNLTFATLLQQLQACFEEKWQRPPIANSAFEVFTNDFFQASLYHVQRIMHIAQRRERRMLSSKLARIEFIRLLSRIWLTVFELFPTIEPTSLPLLQVYFLLRDGNFQFELSYLTEQLRLTPFTLQLLPLFGNDPDASDVNFPFDLMTFAHTVGLNAADTSMFWTAILDLMAFLATSDPRVKARFGLLHDDFLHTASLLFLPIKSDEMLASLSADLYINDAELQTDEASPLEEIAVLRKELTQQIESSDPKSMKALHFASLFVFIGQPGRGQRDAARILRHQFAQIELWPFQQGYYEWDIQKRLNYPIDDLEQLLQHYEKGCIYFHNFPPLFPSSRKDDKKLVAFLNILKAHLRNRMFIFDFVSVAQALHYFPELENTQVFVVRFKPYTASHLQHHFRQLAVLSEIDVSSEAYPCLRDLYEKAKPFFDKGVYPDQFVYQLFAESLRNMSLRIKEGFLRNGALLNSEIVPADLLQAFHLLLHL